MADTFDQIAPRALGERLQQARKAAGMTQQDVADALEIARTTIVAIEKGERRVQPTELIRLATLFGRQVSDFLRTSDPVPSLAMQLRATLPPDAPITELVEPHVWEFQRLCEDYVELERILDAPLPRLYPAERLIPNRALDHAAEDLATVERMRLGLGDGPLPNLREMLEREVGLRIFFLPMAAHISAMFAYSEVLGGCILVNQNHPEERRRNSLSHEYAHFLTTRQRSEIELGDRYRRKPEHERIANIFARSFLMPASGIRRRFNELQRARSDFTTADLLTMAHYYGVSLESLTLRLEELRLIRVGTWERVQESRLNVREARSILGFAAPDVSDDVLPMRYVFLALEAFRRDLLSEERLARLLRVDRLEARRLVWQLEQNLGVTDEETGDYPVDATTWAVNAGREGQLPRLVIDRRIPISAKRALRAWDASQRPSPSEPSDEGTG